jgi:outer membrane protein assembly factor BamB
MKNTIWFLLCLGTLLSLGCETKTKPEEKPAPAADELQSKDVLWQYELKSPAFASAAVDDIDGNGDLEIVFGTYLNDEQIVALNAQDGTKLWSFTTGGRNDTATVIADIDMDGMAEVIGCVSSKGIVHCLDGRSGSPKWSHAVAGAPLIESSPAVGDIDGDGYPEVVFGTYDGHLLALDGRQGNLDWQIILGASTRINAEVNLLDINVDSRLEVVAYLASGKKGIISLSGSDGNMLWNSTLPQGDILHAGAFADIDKDGKMEIVVGSIDRRIYALNSEDGSLLWDFLAPFEVGAPTTIADFNGDGTMEIAWAAKNRLGVLDSTGKSIWEFSTDGFIFRGVVATDINSDSRYDLVFITDNGVLYSIKGDNGQEIQKLKIVPHYGKTVWVDHVPVIADGNNDGLLEIFFVVGTVNGSNPATNSGRAYAIKSSSTGRFTWKTFRADLTHSGTVR